MNNESSEDVSDVTYKENHLITVCMFVCLSVCPPVSLFIYPSICASTFHCAFKYQYNSIHSNKFQDLN